MKTLTVYWVAWMGFGVIMVAFDSDKVGGAVLTIISLLVLAYDLFIKRKRERPTVRV